MAFRTVGFVEKPADFIKGKNTVQGVDPQVNKESYGI